MKTTSPIRWLLFSSILIIITVLWGNTMLSSLIRKMIYPAPFISVTTPPPGMQEVFITSESAPTTCAWLYEYTSAGENSPVVLLFHGNGENLETMKLSGTLDQFQSLNISFLAADYPGYGKSEGSAAEETNIRAAEAALEWLNSRYPSRPIVILGWSLGAGVGLQAAAKNTERVSGLILLSPWSSLADVAAVHYPAWLVEKVLPESYNSLRAAAQINCPTLILHGEVDRIIPVQQGKVLAKAFPQPVKLITLPGVGHNDIFSEPTVWHEIRAFLKKIE